MSPLRPEDLRSLLHEAVDEVRPSPDGYSRIQAGIARRRRWRVPAYAAGAAVLAGLAALAFFAISPGGGGGQVVLPASPITSRLGSGAVATTATTAPSPETAGGPAGPPPGGDQTAGPTSPPVTPSSPPQTTHPTTTPTRSGSNSTPATIAKDGDIDGDGIVDSGITYNGSALVVTLSRLGQTKAVTLPGVVKPLHRTVVDLDDDGLGEIVVEVQGSGLFPTYAVVRLQPDGSLRVLSGGPLPLAAGASATAGSGFSCSGGLILARAGTSEDGVTYQVTTTTWRLSGVTFQQVGKVVTSSYDTTSNVANPFTAQCGTLN
jgi:hypothetical protein